jgi:hypothetical protein
MKINSFRLNHIDRFLDRLVDYLVFPLSSSLASDDNNVDVISALPAESRQKDCWCDAV